MSAAPSPSDATERSREMSQLQARRLQARRRRRVARVDVGLGVLAAITLWIAMPGLAIVALVALLMLVLCAVSVVLGRRAARRPSGEARRVPGGPARAQPAPRQYAERNHS